MSTCTAPSQPRATVRPGPRPDRRQLWGRSGRARSRRRRLPRRSAGVGGRCQAVVCGQEVGHHGPGVVPRPVDLAGVPAVTRHRLGAGTSWYLATLPDEPTLAALLDRIRTEAGVRPVRETAPGVEAVLRRGPDADYLFLINHSAHDVETPARGLDLVTGDTVDNIARVPAGAVRVIREDPAR